MVPMDAKALLACGQAAMSLEAAALTTAGSRLGETFAGAVQAVLSRAGKVVVTGLGKSGHVARKVASTLSSTGTSSFFLHPTEALHGDFGMLQAQDCLLAFAFGGETNEVLEVCRFARRIGVPVISFTGNLSSSLAKLSDFVLDAGVAREADPLNLAPTCSSTVAMALGDAVAVTLMTARGFGRNDFASLHPGGSLGRRLSLVGDHMRGAPDFPTVGERADFHTVLEAVTAFNFGIVAVVGPQGELVGAVSDGDVRRALLKFGGQALATHAAEFMTKSPRTIAPTALALDALRVMNDARITQLFVAAPDDPRPLGIVRLHDLLAAKIL